MKINLQKIHKRIERQKLVQRLQLITGNCGTFAIALQGLLGRGKLHHLGYGAHILLHVGKHYIDGTGKLTYQEMMQDWGRYARYRVERNDTPENVLESTSWSIDVDEMRDIIKRLNSGQSVRAYYRE